MSHALSSLPTVTYPFAPRIHAEADLAEAHVRYFGRRFGLCASQAARVRFDAAGFGVFAARTCPDVGDVELMGEWAAWLFVFDDEFDEAAEPTRQVARLAPVLAQMRRVLTPSLDFQARTSNPYTTALADMWPRTARLMSRGWRVRFARNLTAYVEAYAEELSNRRHADPPTLEEYLPFRRVVSAVEPCLDMIEVGLGRSLPQAVADGAACRELRSAANDIISWTNDLVSFNKEHARGDANNLVSVLAHANGLPFDEAAGQTAAMIDARVGDFLRHRRALPVPEPQPGRDPPAADLLTRCADAMAAWMAGSLAWHTWSGRYRQVEYTGKPRDPSYYLPLL